MLFLQKQIPADILSLPGSVIHDLLLITYYLLFITYYLLLITCYPLPVVLPVTYHPLYNAYYFYILNFRYSSGFR